MASDTLTQSRPTMCPEIVYIEQLRCALRDLEDDMTTIRFTVDFLREEIERGERDRIGTHQRILVEALSTRVASFEDDLERLSAAARHVSR
jgi:hypothetical protein